jgi:hypothetical protein
LKKSNKNRRVYPGSLYTEWKLVTPEDPIYFIERVYSSPVSVSAIEMTYKEKIKEVLNET